MEGLAPIWPDRLKLGGVPLGDVWPCDVLKPSAVNEGDELVPFHKLTGWITYSLLEPLQKVLGWKFDGIENMTGLPEYRNGAQSYKVLFSPCRSPMTETLHRWAARRLWRAHSEVWRASEVCLPRSSI
jgi:hypothetical protein